jgi:hypothetical protein
VRGRQVLLSSHNEEVVYATVGPDEHGRRGWGMSPAPWARNVTYALLMRTRGRSHTGSHCLSELSQAQVDR